MTKRVKKWMWWGGTLLVIGGLTTWGVISARTPGKYDDFARCLKDKNIKFYGAFWCPHCQNQKKLFGKSAKYLPYIECSTANGQGQLPICADAKVEGYPTWEYADGTRQSGEVPLATLAEKSGCQLPQ